MDDLIECLRAHAESLRDHIVQPALGEDIERAATELAALRAECDALRAALRKHAIEGFFTGELHYEHCHECGSEWNRGETELHASGCLTAPGK